MDCKTSAKVSNHHQMASFCDFDSKYRSKSYKCTGRERLILLQTILLLL